MTYGKNDISNDPRVPYIVGSPVRFKQEVAVGVYPVEAGTSGVVTSVPTEDEARLVVKADADFGDESSDVVWEGDELNLVTEDLEFDPYNVSGKGKRIIGSLMHDTINAVLAHIPVASEHFFGNRIAVVLDSGSQVEAEVVEINEFGWSVRVHVRYEDEDGHFIAGRTLEVDGTKDASVDELAAAMVAYTR